MSIVFKNITSRLTPQCHESVNVGLSAGHTLTDHFAFRRLIVCRKACKGLVRQGLCTASNRILIRTKLILSSLQPCFQRSASRVRVLLLAGRRFYHRHFESQPRASNSFFRSMVFVPHPCSRERMGNMERLEAQASPRNHPTPPRLGRKTRKSSHRFCEDPNCSPPVFVDLLQSMLVLLTEAAHHVPPLIHSPKYFKTVRKRISGTLSQGGHKCQENL